MSNNLLHPNVTENIDLANVDTSKIPETFEEMDLLNKKRDYDLFKNLNFEGVKEKS